MLKKRVKAAVDKRIFRKTANRTNVKNISGKRNMRGGFHL